MARMTARKALAEMLVKQRVRYVFGNPGTTELPLIDVLQDYPQLEYVLALQEAVAVAMADGYARAMGTPSFVNLHTAGGLANGISMLYNAYRGGTPMVLTAGQLDTRMILGEPVLWGDQVEMCRQYTKWSVQVSHPKDVPAALRRAFRIAATPPAGPVFLALPWDVLDGEDEMDTTPPSRVYDKIGPDPEAVRETASLLCTAQRPLMLVGDRVAQCGALEEAVRVAELTGAEVLAVSFSEVNFPTGHPQFTGFLNVDNPKGHEVLSKYDVIMAVGCNVFSQFLYTGPLLRGNSKLIHVDVASREIEKNYPVVSSLWADIQRSLHELSERLGSELDPSQKEAASKRIERLKEAKARKREALERRWKGEENLTPVPADRMMYEVSRLMPKESVVVHEAVTTSVSLYRVMEFNEPGSLYGQRGGALGWGIGGALGVQLAMPQRRVVAFIGEGSAMYTIQGLWTAVRYQLPVIYVICNNQSYRILKHFLVNYYYPTLGIRDRKSSFIGMDFSDCPIRCSEVAKAFGLWTAKVEDQGQLRDVFEDALQQSGPALIEVPIHPGDYR